jgi:FtsZ-binding cell division protein ZapB
MDNRIEQIREKVNKAIDDLELTGRSGYYPYDDMEYLLQRVSDQQAEIERLRREIEELRRGEGNANVDG